MKRTILLVPALLVKSQISGYTKSNGTFVAAHTDKRASSGINYDLLKPAAAPAPTSNGIRYDLLPGHRPTKSAAPASSRSARPVREGDGFTFAGTDKIKSDALAMGLNAFLDKYVAEKLPEHMQHGLAPAKMVHEQIATGKLDPTEWDDWDEHKSFKGSVMPGSSDHIKKISTSIKAGKFVAPALVSGGPDGADVMDGHHRTAAHREAGASHVNVVYDIDTLTKMWAKQRGVKAGQKETNLMAKKYQTEHLASRAVKK